VRMNLQTVIDTEPIYKELEGLYSTTLVCFQNKHDLLTIL
jgi:hypothetical protein